MTATTHLGADGCPAGWIVAEASDLRTTPVFWVAATFAELAARAARRGAVTCIDVPIGLSADRRACDVAARKLLGPSRASSVFTPPCRAALAGPDRTAMRALNVRVTGRSLSEQTLGILPKIREVDAGMTPALQARVKEVHPELVFAAAGRGLADGKRTARGRAARLALLPRSFARAAPTRGRQPWPASQVALDDYVDALAALVAAVRIARGEGRRLPAGPAERDERGLSMEIWY